MDIEHLPYSEDELRKIGLQRTFTGVQLSEIAFPIGGIGAGSISIGGRGDLRDFEIFGHPNRDYAPPFTFFALWAREEGQAPVARILEGRIPPPYRGGGEADARLSGLPRFRDALFRGEYPFASLTLRDASVPVQAELTAWNPFIPLNVHDSALPIANFEWTLTNPGNRPVEVSLVANLANPLTATNERGELAMPGALNSYRNAGALRGVFLNHPEADPALASTGTMALTTSWTDIDVVTHWHRGGWWDSSYLFWKDFSETGRVTPLRDADPAPIGNDVASVVLHAVVPAGGSVTLPVSISWHFAKMPNPWREDSPDLPVVLDTYAGAHFCDAWEVAAYAWEQGPRLRAISDRWRETIFSSTLPNYVLEAITSQASILRTTTCFLLADGSFFGWEGCWNTGGSCPGSCTHVWNYEQALAFLFPELERTMRRTEFLHNTRPSGNMAFRTLLPPGAKLSDFKPCVDGQMGVIIQVYRDWQLSGDDAFLRELWPSVKRALEYAWTMTPEGMGAELAFAINSPGPANRSIDSLWDPDKDGLMEGEQHNTYDIEFYGPNTLCTGMYLGALRACEEIARYLGEPDKAGEYRAIYESGRAKVDGTLWNGEYYIQKVNVIPEITVPEILLEPADPVLDGEGLAGSPSAPRPKYQYGDGCLSDQLIGQWAAHVAGLGYLLDEGHVCTAIQSVFRNNFRESLANEQSVQRIYGINDEPGLLLCSWPRGNRPMLAFSFSDEVWTGIEYQVAAHLIYEGWMDEGLTVVKAVSERYSGHNRNPWNQIECGYHYARAMASWSVKLALDGFRYSAVNGMLAFAPKLARSDFRTFWSTGTGWGRYHQNLQHGTFMLEVLAGAQTLRRLELADLPDGPISVTDPSGLLAAYRDGDAVILDAPITLTAGESITVKTSPRLAHFIFSSRLPEFGGLSA